MTWNYIAGFFDGEGSLVYNGKGFRIMISQTNEEVLEEIKEFTKLGGVIKTTKRQEHWKDSWVYYVAKQKDVLKFLKFVTPLLIVKKEKAEKAIPQLKIFIKKQNAKKRKLKKKTHEAKKLREKGFTYREIGKTLGIDFGYARRLILKQQ